ncbi:hypothetical protein VTP01DRAFT_1907 [Rhizomucor pusillus]|uniref:uncharacterized protein n=1 Tax=Rhizomucor pusillus TaxID=4840 RepID=UPI003743E82F
MVLSRTPVQQRLAFLAVAGVNSVGNGGSLRLAVVPAGQNFAQFRSVEFASAKSLGATNRERLINHGRQVDESRPGLARSSREQSRRYLSQIREFASLISHRKSYPGTPIVQSTAVGSAMDRLARKRSRRRRDNDSDATTDAAVARFETRMAMMDSDMAELRQLVSAQSQQVEAMLEDSEPNANVVKNAL